MVYQSKRWRIGARAITLAITSLLMLLFAGPATYALHSDSPVAVSTSGQLFDNQRPVEGSYIDARGLPDLDHTVATSALLTTYYWIPVAGYDNRLFIRTNDPQYLFPTDYDAANGFAPLGEISYTGKVLSLKGQMFADDLVEALALQGIAMDKEQAMFVAQGEVPSAYRPIVPVIPFLAWAWLFAFVGLFQIVRGRNARPAHRAAPARNA